jgi:hypothetical protein
MFVIKFMHQGKCVGMLSFRGTLEAPGEELGGVYPPDDGIHQVDTVIVHHDNNGEEKVYSGFTHWRDILNNAPEVRYPCGHYESWCGTALEEKECPLCARMGNTCPECGTALEKSPYPQDHGALVCPLGGH